LAAALVVATPASAVVFDVNIYADSAGAPGSILASEQVNASAVNTGLTETDCCQPIVKIFAFHADLSHAVSLDANTPYWLSIVEPVHGLTISTFRWADGTSTAGDPNNEVLSFGTLPWFNGGNGLGRGQAAYSLGDPFYIQPLTLNNDGGPFSALDQQIADQFLLGADETLTHLDWFGDNGRNSFPEPVTVATFGLGLIGLGALRKRARR
jgi:hypothetical protein